MVVALVVLHVSGQKRLTARLFLWPSSPIATVTFAGYRGGSNIAPEVSKRFPYSGFDGLRASFHLAQQHGALNSGDTEVGQTILVSVRHQSTLRLFPDKKGSQLVLHDFKKMAEVLPDELRPSLSPPDSSKWDSPSSCEIAFAARCARRTTVPDHPKSRLHS
jgi:hypothetical protein